MAAGVFLGSFEESNARKKQMVEQWILSNINSGQLEEGLPVNFHRNISFYLTELPDLAQWPQDLKARVLAVLVDGDMKEDLERAGLINWCRNVKNVLPLSVPRDGNCLLHSMATAVWAVHDGTLMLRRLLSLALSVDPAQRFYGRWVQHRSSQLAQVGERLLESGTEELKAEWSEISQCLDANSMRSAAVPHRFLEAIHVYTLANVFRRPIIVLTDPTVRTFSGLSLQDNDMGGIYLPLEWSWGNTSHTPVLLAFSHNHFSPLLFGEYPNQALAGNNQSKNLIPLVNARFEQLPVRFLLQGEEPEVWALLSKYLKVKETVMQVSGTVQNVLCAEIESCTLPADLNLVNEYFQHCLRQYRQERSAAYDLQHQRALLSQTAGPSQQVVREQLQKLPAHEFSLADPNLQETGAWGQQQICIPAPSFTPHVSDLLQNVSLNPPQEKKCVVPTCTFYGDPDLGMMCSNCFKKYTIKESRNRNTNTAALARPTAPLPSFQAEERFQTSMMSERCQEGCGFRCSTHTYPYCHECADKRRKQAQEQASKATASSFVEAPPSAGGASNLVFLPPSTLLQTRLEAAGVTQMNDFNQVHSSASASATAAGGVSVPGQKPGSASNTDPVGAKPADIMSPTQVLAAGEQSAPLTPTGDISEALLFGSGVASPLSAGQAEHETSQECGQTPVPVFFQQPPPVSTATIQASLPGQQSYALTNMANGNPQCSPLTVPPSGQDLLSSVANMTESQLAEVVTGLSTGKAKPSCSSPGCSGAAVHRDLCAKCYVGEGLAASPNPTLQRLKQINPFSLASSAPASIGPVASNTQGLVQNRSQTPTLMNLPEQLPAYGSSKKDLVQNWLENKSSTLPVTGRERAISRQLSQPVGLPERQESEPLGNDLIVSGLECGPVSPTLRCTECSNRVQGEGPLCQQCRDILRQYRQAHSRQRHLSSVQETSPSQQPEKACLAEGCRYAGSPQCLGYCSVCYAQLFKRQLEAETHQTHPANRSHTLPHPTPPAPPSDFSVPVAGASMHGLHCTVQGCTRFGDPKQKGMCGMHYQDHLATFQTATVPKRSHSAPMASRRGEVNISIPIASQVRVTPYATTIYAPPVHAQVVSGEEVGGSPASYGQGEPSISSASFESGFAGVGRAQELSLGETFNRVALRNSSKCLSPDCNNFANSSKGGYCNSCSDRERRKEQMLNRIILGEEQTG